MIPNSPKRKLVSTVEEEWKENSAPYPEPFNPLPNISTSSSSQSLVPRNLTIHVKAASCIFHDVEKGHDSTCISDDCCVLAVADGVGECTLKGKNPRPFADKVAERSCFHVGNQPQSPKQLSQAVRDAVKEIQSWNNPSMQGSCTLCLCSIVQHDGQGVLHHVNIGDSGFLLIRDGDVVAQSTPTYHTTMPRCPPYQLSVKDLHDIPEHDQTPIILQRQDILVLGSDGLLDNLFDWEIAKTVSFLIKNKVDVETAATYLALLASQKANDRLSLTPYGLSRFPMRLGGKPDDIGVIVAHIF